MKFNWQKQQNGLKYSNNYKSSTLLTVIKTNMVVKGGTDNSEHETLPHNLTLLYDSNITEFSAVDKYY